MGSTPIKADWLDQISEDMDLRRRREDSLTDRVVRRAYWLDPCDRELVLAMFRDGHSANTISKLTGECPRHTRRRIKRLVGRLNDPRIAYVVAHNTQWSKSRQAIARSLYIQGKSMRETTDELGISFYSVRKHREAIEAMVDASIQSQGTKSTNRSSGSISRSWRSRS